MRTFFITRTSIHPAFRLLAALLLALCLAGCDGPDRDAANNADHVPGVTDTEIRVGSSLALSGHASFLGLNTLRGAQTYINYINDNGGVHGRKIKLIALDDRYDPPLCIANTQRLLVEEDVFVLFCYVGTPTTVKIIPLVEKAKTPLIGMFTGANALRDPFHRYIINVRPSYYQETGAAVQHFVEDLGLDKIAVFYQYDAYGFDGLRGAELALKKYNAAPVAKGTYIRGTLDVEEGLQAILESEAQAVIMIGTYEPCAKFIKLARLAGKDLLFYNVSFVGAEELVRLLGPDGDGVIISQVVPQPELSNNGPTLPEIQQYLEHSKHYFPDERPNSVGLEGYLNAMVLVEGLERAGRRLTRERLINAIETIRNHPLGQETLLSFGPEDHQGMDRVYFNVIKDGKLVLVDDWRDLPGIHGKKEQ